jgi:hypothetical protein
MHLMSQTFKIQNGDCVLDQSGSVVMVADLPKLRQDLSELFSVSILDNGFGAGLVDLIGAVDGFDDGYAANIEFTLRERLEAGLKRLMTLQRRSLQNMPPEETITGIGQLDVQRDPTNPTVYRWKATIKTLAGDVSRSGKLSLPG